MFGENAFEKNKTHQNINQATCPNMVTRSSNAPSYKTWQQNTVDDDLPSNFSVEIKQKCRQNKKWYAVMVQMFNVGMDERAKNNTFQAIKR